MHSHWQAELGFIGGVQSMSQGLHLHVAELNPNGQSGIEGHSHWHKSELSFDFGG
jgi:hypothetical protein